MHLMASAMSSGRLAHISNTIFFFISFRYHPLFWLMHPVVHLSSHFRSVIALAEVMPRFIIGNMALVILYVFLSIEPDKRLD